MKERLDNLRRLIAAEMGLQGKVPVYVLAKRMGFDTDTIYKWYQGRSPHFKNELKLGRFERRLKKKLGGRGHSPFSSCLLRILSISISWCFCIAT